MTPFECVSPFYICIIKLTYRDKNEPWNIQIIRMFTTRSKQQTVITHLCPGDLH